MKIRIVVDDRLVSVDGSVIEMPGLDWGKFDGDPSSPWDDIAAVQFDTDLGQGQVEYREVTTSQATRHNMRPPDWNIRQAEFDELFSWVLPLHAARKVEIEAERAKAEAEAEKARQEAEAAFLAKQQADLERQQAEANRINRGEAEQAPAAAVDLSHLETALAEKDAEIAGMRAKQADLEAKVNAMLQAAKDVGGEAA